MDNQLLHNMIEEMAGALSRVAEGMAPTAPEAAYEFNILAGNARNLAAGVRAYQRDQFANGCDPVYLAINLGRSLEGLRAIDFAAPFDLTPCNSEHAQAELLRLLALLQKAPQVKPAEFSAAAEGLAVVEDGRLEVAGRYNIRSSYRASIPLVAGTAGAAELVLTDHAETLCRARDGKRPVPRRWTMPAGTAGAVELLIAGALALLGKDAWK